MQPEPPKLLNWLISFFLLILIAAMERGQGNWNFGTMVERVLRSNLFFSPQAYRARIKSPVEFALGMARALQAQTDRLVQEILALEGYPVMAAANGAEALRSIEQARPALVLLDMRMPVLDGWGFADALKARGLAVPVLVMTAAQDARRWAAEIAADGYIAKPFGLLDLLRAVARFVPPPAGGEG